MSRKVFSISDGDLVLTIELERDGTMLVRSPTDPAMITQATNIPQAFANARDAFKLLAESRSDPRRWEQISTSHHQKPKKRTAGSSSKA